MISNRLRRRARRGRTLHRPITSLLALQFPRLYYYSAEHRLRRPPVDNPRAVPAPPHNRRRRASGRRRGDNHDEWIGPNNLMKAYISYIGPS
jgi:hypothetical protein